MQKNFYERKFEGNILVVGRTGCGKTYFFQRLALNNIFGKLEKIERVSRLRLSVQESTNSVLLYFPLSKYYRWNRKSFGRF